MNEKNKNITIKCFHQNKYHKFLYQKMKKITNNWHCSKSIMIKNTRTKKKNKVLCYNNLFDTNYYNTNNVFNNYCIE